MLRVLRALRNFWVFVELKCLPWIPKDRRNTHITQPWPQALDLETIWVVVKIRVPILGTLKNRCRIKLRTQKGTLILTTTHINVHKVRVFGGQPDAFFPKPRHRSSRRACVLGSGLVGLSKAKVSG